ncbi:hypothetical protein GcM3_187019 [Golovinomyces cichoracearum]|uniref:Uncharacterized protein n=1 Tax=Golovinomyces cichoracearum TaxID=62708 RepID=A0A420HJ98_9PEZI|nr:hypothetical protein GcM3_187019 [Golovinomyces cichoracearum]
MERARSPGWAAVKDIHQEKSKKLSLSLYQLSVQNQPLLHEKIGLHKALITKKKRKTQGKALDFEQSKKDRGRTVFYSSHTIRVVR